MAVKRLMRSWRSSVSLAWTGRDLIERSDICALSVARAGTAGIDSITEERCFERRAHEGFCWVW